MPNAPTVKTHVYEGPLDLLLELIEKRKLHISDISLAEVTDEYIARLNTMEEIPVGETAEFISLAATLLLIKSRSLLPTLSLTGEESTDIRQLQYRLSVYQNVQEATRTLRSRWCNMYMFEGVYPEPLPHFVFDSKITAVSIRASAERLLEGFPTNIFLPKIEVTKIASLEETVEMLAKRVSAAFTISFYEFSGLDKKKGAHMKQMVIISFLALLELIKQGIIRAQQSKDFDDIILESDAITTPIYE